MKKRLLFAVGLGLTALGFVWLVNRWLDTADRFKPADAEVLASAQQFELVRVEPHTEQELEPLGLASITGKTLVEGQAARDTLSALKSAFRHGAWCEQAGPYLQRLPFLPEEMKPDVPWVPQFEVACGVVLDYDIYIPTRDRPQLEVDLDTLRNHRASVRSWAQHPYDDFYDLPIKLKPEFIRSLEQLLSRRQP